MPHAGATPSAWAVDTVRASAVELDTQDWQPEVDDASVTDNRIGVATAAAALLAAHPEDDELRQLVFRGAAVAQPEVAKSFLRGLIPAWATQPETPANVLGILLATALLDRDKKLDKAEIDAFLEADVAGTVVAWPSLDGAADRAMHLIPLALGVMCAHYRNQRAIGIVLPLAGALVSLARRPEDRVDALMLRNAVGNLCAALLVAIPDTTHAEFRQSISDWEPSLELYADIVAALVRGYVRSHDLSEQTVRRFDEIALVFLDADHSASLEAKHLDRDFRDACWALVMAQEFEGIMPVSDWPHASRFTEHIERWTKAVGGHPATADALVRFMERFSPAFPVARIVHWLSLAASNTSSVMKSEFWSINGDNINTLLLRLFETRSSEFADLTTLHVAATLTENLLEAGVAGAGQLRRAVETVSRRTA